MYYTMNTDTDSNITYDVLSSASVGNHLYLTPAPVYEHYFEVEQIALNCAKGGMHVMFIHMTPSFHIEELEKTSRRLKGSISSDPNARDKFDIVIIQSGYPDDLSDLALQYLRDKTQKVVFITIPSLSQNWYEEATKFIPAIENRFGFSVESINANFEKSRHISFQNFMGVSGETLESPAISSNRFISIQNLEISNSHEEITIHGADKAHLCLTSKSDVRFFAGGKMCVLSAVDESVMVRDLDSDEMVMVLSMKNGNLSIDALHGELGVSERYDTANEMIAMIR